MTPASRSLENWKDFRSRLLDNELGGVMFWDLASETRSHTLTNQMAGPDSAGASFIKFTEGTCISADNRLHSRSSR